MAVEPEHIVFLPNLVNGLFIASKAIGAPDERILVRRRFTARF